MAPRAGRLIAGVFVVPVLLLAGCGGGSSSSNTAPAADQGPQTGTINVLGSDNAETYAPVIKAFESANAGIKVNYSQVPFDQFNSTLQQRLGAKDSTIDVYTVDQPRVSQLAAKGFLVDLTDLDAKTKAATSQASYDANHFRDKLWSLPMWNSTQFLFYNKSALKKAGVTPPTTDPEQRWTWEQVATAGKKAQQAGGTKYGLLLEQAEAYYQLQPLAESLGGGSGITGPDALTPAVTTDGWKKAMSWYGGTFASGLSPRGIGGFQTGPVFSNGNVAFFVGGPWDIGVFSSAKVDWGIAPMPYFEGGKPVTPTGSWSLGINPASKQQGMARKFIEFATLDTAGNLATTEATTIIPANTKSEAQYLPRLEKLAGSKSTGAAEIVSYEASKTAVGRPVSVGYIQFEEVMGKAFADIRNGTDAASRLETATSQLNEAWKSIK
ncbi:multiple sugar transport system substrate-binding protein [Kribbella antiqua]|uniref:Multiple sugar transport system substrate-binding protein n=1 Tax=Kribbella antiqua TaxID=2512217 RepID=A0A4R2I2R3_9ACTN|nr:sugar ABC transporter substrate-binding protein [Kribbella antiqua]TCO38127.1 multiple sugar transport system substrate-binding protein [Kribbella antiqua]